MSQNGPVIRRSSPQIAQVSSISSTMLDVIVALLPALGMAVYLFGPRVLALTLVSVAACVGAEYGYRRLMGLSNTVGDLSACVTGLLLAMSLPVTAPYWAPGAGRCLCHRGGQAVLRRAGTELYESRSGGDGRCCAPFPD